MAWTSSGDGEEEEQEAMDDVGEVAVSVRTVEVPFIVPFPALAATPASPPPTCSDLATTEKTRVVAGFVADTPSPTVGVVVGVIAGTTDDRGG